MSDPWLPPATGPATPPAGTSALAGPASAAPTASPTATLGWPQQGLAHQGLAHQGLAHQGLAQQGLPQQTPWATPTSVLAPPTQPTAARPPASRTAIVALVLSGVALLGVLVVGGMAFLAFGAMGASSFGGFGGGFGDEYELLGTLPDVEVGEEYPQDRLVAEIERVLENDWSTYEDISCEPLVDVGTGATTSCTGFVDGMDTVLEVEVEDDLGHFVLTQTW